MESNPNIYIESHVGAVSAEKFAREIGKSVYWVREQCRIGDIPALPRENENLPLFINVREWNRRIDANEVIIRSGRGVKTQGAGA